MFTESVKDESCNSRSYPALLFSTVVAKFDFELFGF